MGKLSSYQKLKLENIKLEHDIYNLVTKQNEPEGLSVRLMYSRKFDLDKIRISGKRDSDFSNHTGIRSILKNK